MEVITFIVSKICSGLIDLLLLAITVRVLLSWISMDEDNPIDNFLFAFTEPVIIPFRILLSKFESMRMMPIDIPLLLTSFVLVILSSLLSAYG